MTHRALIAVLLATPWLGACSPDQQQDLSLNRLQLLATPPARAAAIEPQSTVPDESLRPGNEGATFSDPAGPWPAGPESRSTTDGDVYLANLDGQIAVLSGRLDGPGSAGLRHRLALLLYHRFQVTGRLADAERARDLVTVIEADLDSRPAGSDAALAAARIRLGFHEFDAARAALDSARKAGASPAEVETLQSALDDTLGASWGRPPQPPESPADTVSVVRHAAALAERGEAMEAGRWLHLAQAHYRGSSPFVLAWIQAQQGILYLRAGDLEGAQRFFAASHERLPRYALAAEHLAEVELALGNTQRAKALYEAVAAQTGHPEFLAQLAEAERALGETELAARHAREAEAGYAALVARYPLMYADHAAHYYLAQGQTQRALALARQNRASRADLGARLLLVEVAVAAQEDALACEGLADLEAAGYAPPEMTGLKGELDRRCESGAGASFSTAGAKAP